MQKFIIKTHGCKANQLESSVIRDKLTKNGFSEAENIEDADLFILNSCSVTENADNEALRMLRNIKAKNKNITTILTGCSAQLNVEKLKDNEYVDLIVGNDDKFQLADLIKKRENKVTDIFSIDKFNNQPVYEYKKTRGYLKIQDGCNNACSYCTIRLARGKSRSNSIENIIEQVNIYVKANIKEIVLTGIHIGQWGEDFTPAQSLIDLLKEIEKTDIVRYRLGSLNPLEITDELLDFLSKSDKFCPHFHLSIQSLTDKTLQAMNRKYTAKNCLDVAEKIDKMFNLPFIGSDIIVGFPGETLEDYNKTIENVIKSKLSNIHVFPYSIRLNTPAAKMSNQISEQEKKQRAEKLHKIANEKFMNFIEKNIGTTAKVLIEKRPDKHTRKLKGVTENYLNIHIDSEDKAFLNTIQQVKIRSIDKNNQIKGIIQTVKM